MVKDDNMFVSIRIYFESILFVSIEKDSGYRFRIDTFCIDRHARIEDAIRIDRGWNRYEGLTYRLIQRRSKALVDRWMDTKGAVKTARFKERLDQTGVKGGSTRRLRATSPREHV